jgi:hypothetical protein
MKNMNARECIVCGKNECNDPKCIAIAELRGGDRMNELLMRYCIEHVYDHARNDKYNDTVELLCRICGCTENELFKMFEQFAQDGGYDLVYVL